LNHNPYRVAFLPLELPQSFETTYREQILDETYPIWCGSAVGLLDELNQGAPVLGISGTGTGLTDQVAHRINECLPLFDGDSDDQVKELRTTWLLAHEGARLAIETNVALSLAG
jgi:hypothetical protein